VKRGALAALMLVLGFAASGSVAADFKTLRKLEAPPPIAVSPLPVDAKVSPVRLSKVVLQPRQGESWALVYTGAFITDPEDPPPRDELLPWRDARSESDTTSFERIFDEELQVAGFKTAGGGSLFEQASATDLQVGVLVDDIKGRFCRDCPNLFQRDKISAVVTMNARWEVYSSLRSEVVMRLTTSTGATWRKRVDGNATLVMFDAFRENVRALLASEAFRQAVQASPASLTPRPALTPISYVAMPSGKRTISNAAPAVAAIFAGDGMGTGFLISKDGYLLTNNHVVSGAKYVKVRWADGAETVGEVIRSDRRRDIAVVKADPGQRQALAVRASAATLGEAVYAIGSPLGAKFQGSVTKGIVSATTRTHEGLPYVQSDVAINHGNSGGPLLDENGAVIGVAVSGMEISGAPVGINLFIPIDDALKALALTPAP
jgi:S1-C subfamily serine protease